MWFWAVFVGTMGTCGAFLWLIKRIARGSAPVSPESGLSAGGERPPRGKKEWRIATSGDFVDRMLQGLVLARRDGFPNALETRWRAAVIASALLAARLHGLDGTVEVTGPGARWDRTPVAAARETLSSCLAYYVSLTVPPRQAEGYSRAYDSWVGASEWNHDFFLLAVRLQTLNTSADAYHTGLICAWLLAAAAAGAPPALGGLLAEVSTRSQQIPPRPLDLVHAMIHAPAPVFENWFLLPDIVATCLGDGQQMAEELSTEEILEINRQAGT